MVPGSNFLYLMRHLNKEKECGSKTQRMNVVNAAKIIRKRMENHFETLSCCEFEL